MRYILRHEKNTILANGETGLLVGHYQSDSNAKRFLTERLAKADESRFPPGNYVIQTWPEIWTGPHDERTVGAVYKRV